MDEEAVDICWTGVGACGSVCLEWDVLSCMMSPIFIIVNDIFSSHRTAELINGSEMMHANCCDAGPSAPPQGWQPQ